LIALDTFASQRTFRALLEALAHPGRIVPLPAQVTGEAPPALAVPLALADLGQAVAVVGTDARRWAERLSDTTSCSIGAAAEADQVVVLDGATAALVGSLRRGTPLAPEQGCRLTLGCATLGEGDLRLGLEGPGVADRTEVLVSGVPAEVIEALVAANASFPAGIDTFLISAGGQVVGLPRSLTIDIEEVR
jgi:alpha-D-ribose 1-methylphosphonate 5-triphosphate synthase subunit PhnH